jgi:hypothetical protein
LALYISLLVGGYVVVNNSMASVSLQQYNLQSVSSLSTSQQYQINGVAVTAILSHISRQSLLLLLIRTTLSSLQAYPYTQVITYFPRSVTKPASLQTNPLLA